MKIHIITIGEPLPLKNSTERLYRSGVLSFWLQKRDHDVTFITSNFNHFKKCFHPDRDLEAIDHDGLKIRFLHGTPYNRNIGLGRIINHFIIALNYHRILRKIEKPDVVICSFPTIELSFVASMYCSKNKIPFVIDIRDLWPDIFTQYLPRRYSWIFNFFLWPYYILRDYSLSRASLLIGISEKYLNWGLNAANRERNKMDRVIPLGYSRKSQIAQNNSRSQLKRTELKIPPEVLVATFIGTFGLSYDLETIIKVARSLLKQDIPVMFLLCGDGEQRNNLMQLSSDLSNINFLGWLTEQELNDILSITNVGLACYKRIAPQSLPNKLFEYLSAGVPVISSLKGESKVLIDSHSCGLYYEAENSFSLEESIKSLINNPDKLSKLSTNALNIYNSNFTEEKLFGELVSAIESAQQQTLA